MKTCCCLGLLLGLLVMVHAAHAHRVVVFAWVEGGTVHTESKFSGGKRVQGGKIEVYDDQDTKLLEGTTDAQGRLSFPIPKARQLKVVLTAGMGHSNHWVVRADELGDIPSAPSPGPGDHTSPSSPAVISQPANPTSLNAQTVEQIVERALEKKLAPLKAQLAEQSWGLRDIVAGIGYIIGLMGLASYIHYRKETR